MLILNFLSFYYSPLEQFEINSYNTFLNYSSSFDFLLEQSEFLFYNYVSAYNFLDLVLIGVIVLALQTFLKQNGFIYLFILINILLVNDNFISFSDILIQKFSFETNFNGNVNNYFDLIQTSYAYITLSTNFINIYSVALCFIFIYFVIYLIYNKMISNNTNTLIPSLYQILAENLYKVSLNLFYSILGKHVSIPEFFIKINTVFVFLVISNIQGMIPYISTLTSALTNTFYIALALFISIITTLLDKKGINYFLNLFMPSGCPILLSLLIIPIEVISYSFRLVSLSVRLFANMMAGHTLLKVIVGFS